MILPKSRNILSAYNKIANFEILQLKLENNFMVG